MNKLKKTAHKTPVGVVPYHAKKGETYMSKEMKKHFKMLLEDWKKQLMEKADSTINYIKDESGNFADPNDMATQEEELAFELRERDRDRKLLTKIEQALDVLDVDKYGYCEACGEEIGLRRLEARPTATKCIECKTLDEMKE